MAIASGEPTLDQSALLSVDKALQVIELLLEQPDPLPARVVAKRLGINRTTAHRVLNALIHRGWIEKPDGTTAYRPSLRFWSLIHNSPQFWSFLSEVRPALERLSLLSRETVHLGVLDGFDVLHVDKIDSLENYGISSKVGSREAAHVTGLGKALLAAGSDAFIERYLEHAMGSATRRPIRNPAAFREEIQRTRERGYAIDNEEASPGVRCLGVAVVGASGTPLFAISLTGPASRFTLARVEALAPEAVADARAASSRFGWRATEVSRPDGTRGGADVDGNPTIRTMVANS